MIKQNPLQFAITREDPLIEERLIRDMNAKNLLMICSGGDTILYLKSILPELSITAFDFNPHQLEHFKTKTSDTIVGNFESLFLQWKRFFNEFIVSEADTLDLFNKSGSFPVEIFKSRWWEVSFDLHFHDSFLRTMFGEAAIQHAPKGSYPRYFQKVFEKGLRQDNFQQNPFLQHIFFGKYLKQPEYLTKRPDTSDVQLVQGTLFDVSDIGQFDLIQLSNIFDWSSLEEIKSTCDYLRKGMKSGSVLLVRQINNEAPVDEILGSDFSCDPGLGQELVTQDRSLFYSNIIVARKK
jgi:S-adenosylmethionine-diacylglycerol 3-amino-3-carboxypropyl transferase